MAYTSRVLVVSRQTADSDDLLEALVQRAAEGDVTFTLLMPAPEVGLEARDAARPALETALARMRDAGLEVDGVVGDHEPLEAVVELWKPGAFDEVIVSTLPGATSKWMRMDFPHRVGRICDVPVTHVIARPRDYKAHPTGPPPQHEREPLGPLAVLAWSRKGS